MYDVIVLGVGGIGSAALYYLAQRGAKVLGIERFTPPHDRGSSHGETRIIRKAYFEHPDYVPLLHRAYELWRDLEAQTGKRLYQPVGLLEVGPPQGTLIPGVLQSAQTHNLELDLLSSEDFHARFTGFRLPEGYQAVFERDAGFLYVEECVRTFVEEAQRQGAQLGVEESIQAWRIENGIAIVDTDANRYMARRLVVCPGAWAVNLLSDLGVPLRVVRKHLYWFQNQDARLRAENGGPAFFYETPWGCYYGFPQINELGVKAARHSGGEIVADPLTVDRSLDPADQSQVQMFLRAHLPGVSQLSTHHAVCMYTLTPDEHFLVDRHPDYPQVSFVAGLSGHGFKFAPVLGEILSQFTLDDGSCHPIEFLALRRFKNN
jgi:monomeric sarcosine oxidase